jgi:short-subunit dehydrogenase
LAKNVDEFFQEKFHVINCAGGYWEHFSFTEVSFEQSIRTIQENLHTVFGVAYHLLPLMQERKGGHFVTFGCNSTKYHYPLMAPFTASKQAVATLMTSLCNEYGKYEIQFNCFILTTIKTEREKKIKPFGDFKNWLEPKKVAECVLNLTQQENTLINGGEINLFKYSEQYNWKGYFERIKKS